MSITLADAVLSDHFVPTQASATQTVNVSAALGSVPAQYPVIPSAQLQESGFSSSFGQTATQFQANQSTFITGDHIGGSTTVSQATPLQADACTGPINTGLRVPLNTIGSSEILTEAVSQAAVAAARAAVQATTDAMPQASASAQQDITRLPRIELPTFDGTLLEWPQFWDVFRTSVDEHPKLSNVHKFTHLISSLKGKALKAIDGIAVSADNYAMALGIIKEKFGRKDILITTLYAKLQHLPSAASSASFEDVRRIYDTCEHVLRQLENQGEEVHSQPSLCQQVLSKFPLTVTCKLEEWRTDPQAPWSLQVLRPLLQRYISLQETSRHIAKANSTYSTRSSSSLGPPPPSTVEGLVATHSSSTAKSSEPSSPCVFCSGTHFNDSCKRCTSIDERRQEVVIIQEVFYLLEDRSYCQQMPCQ